MRTCIIVKCRGSSGPVESHFKGSKLRITHKEPEIGALPLKCGRLCRELEKHTKYITTVSAMRAPRKNNCYQQTNKRKTDGNDDELRAKKFKQTDKILSLYEYAPKRKTPKTPKAPKTLNTPQIFTTSASTTKNQQTPTGSNNNPRNHKLDFDLQMDNEKVEEQWFRKRKNQHAYKDKQQQYNQQCSKIQKRFNRSSSNLYERFCSFPYWQCLPPQRCLRNAFRNCENRRPIARLYGFSISCRCKQITI